MKKKNNDNFNLLKVTRKEKKKNLKGQEKEGRLKEKL